jgi:hypothetical protein
VFGRHIPSSDNGKDATLRGHTACMKGCVTRLRIIGSRLIYDRVRHYIGIRSSAVTCVETEVIQGLHIIKLIVDRNCYCINVCSGYCVRIGIGKYGNPERDSDGS